MDTLDSLFSAALKTQLCMRAPRHAHDSERISVALSPNGLRMRFFDPQNGRKRDQDIPSAQAAPWKAFRDAIRDRWPTTIWPVGFKLYYNASYGGEKWQDADATDMYVFGHDMRTSHRTARNSKTKTNNTPTSLHHVQLDNARYHTHNSQKYAIGLDAATDDLRRLHDLFPSSNQPERVFCEAHNLMQTNHVNSRGVVARTEIEALLKRLWLTGGMEAINTFLQEGPRKDFDTWLVATDIANYETDGFAKPQTHKTLHETLQEHMDMLAENARRR